MAGQPLDAMLADAQHHASLAEREVTAKDAADAGASKPRRQRSIRLAKDSVEDLAARTRSQESKRISPDSGSLGRGGRHFTVGNVGNNGRIYLRYGDAFVIYNLIPISLSLF